jgi:hypothetical protein
MDKNKLDGALIYLAGAMEADKQSGTTYRRIFIDKCKAAGLKIKFLDPTNKIMNLTPDVDKEKDKIDEYRNSSNWAALRLLMKKIVRQDLRQVDLADMTIAFIDKQIFTCGTIEEITTNEREKKLTLIISAGGKKACPAWLFGIIHHDFIFESDDEAIEYLVKLNNGTIPMNEKLILFRKELDEYIP